LVAAEGQHVQRVLRAEAVGGRAGGSGAARQGRGQEQVGIDPAAVAGEVAQVVGVVVGAGESKPNGSLSAGSAPARAVTSAATCACVQEISWMCPSPPWPGTKPRYTTCWLLSTLPENT
jgi:hypothetical protein